MGLVILAFLTLGQVQTPTAQADSVVETSSAGAAIGDAAVHVEMRRDNDTVTSNDTVIIITTDMTKPVVTIDNPANGATVTGVFTVDGTAMDDSGMVSVTVALNNNPAEDAQYDPGTNRYTLVMTPSMTDNGPATVTVTAIDPARNTAIQTRSFVISLTTTSDVTKPVVMIDKPLTGTTVITTFTVDGTATDADSGIDSVTVALNNNPAEDAQYNLGTNHYTLDITPTPADNGPATVTVTATDQAGNTATQSRSFVINLTATSDVTKPMVTIDNPLTGTTVITTFTVDGTAMDNSGMVSVTVALNNNPAEDAEYDPATNHYTLNITPTLADNGPATVTVTAIDPARNTAIQSRSFVISLTATSDVTKPMVTIDKPVDGAIVTGVFTVEGTATDADSGIERVEVTLNGNLIGNAIYDANSDTYTLEIDSTKFADGRYTLTVTAVDKSGSVKNATIYINIGNVGPTTVAIVPPELKLASGEEGTTEIQIQNVSNLFGVDFELTFDPNVVEVVDADPSTPGTQIAVGDVFTDQDHFNGVNLVQNGVISFAATLKRPALPFTGTGTLASITWKAIKRGQSNLILEEVKLSEPSKLSDTKKNLIEHETKNGVIIVDGGGGSTITISGKVLLQGRSDHSGTDIFLTEADCTKKAKVFEQSIVPGIPTTKTDSAGNFSITSFPGRTYHCLQAVHRGYVIGQQALPTNKQNLGTINLAGGDVTEDDEIDIFDLVLIATRYNSNNEVTDINGDSLVDIFDLVIAASNFGLAGPQGWPK